MAALIGALRLTLSGTDDLSKSVQSVAATIDGNPSAFERLLDGPFRSLVLGTDLTGLFRVKSLAPPAAGAGELHGLGLFPDQRYIEFVAAVAAETLHDVAVVGHGWPILSPVSGSPTIADRGEAASLSAGGDA